MRHGKDGPGYTSLVSRSSGLEILQKEQRGKGLYS